MSLPTQPHVFSEECMYHLKKWAHLFLMERRGDRNTFTLMAKKPSVSVFIIFTQVKTTKQAMERHLEKQDPHSKFVDNCIESDPNFNINCLLIHNYF